MPITFIEVSGIVGFETDPLWAEILPAGFSEVLITINTEVDKRHHGRTICLKGFSQTWVTTNDVTRLPQWDGPHCFTITNKCCEGRVGDANKLGGDEPTIGDVADMISLVFISGRPVACLDEADVNQSGGTDPTGDDITIGDISVLIDYLFITGRELGLRDCL